MKMLILSLGLAGLFASSATAAPLASSLKGDLVTLKGKRVARFDDTPLTNAKYFAVYFSASWCGPCKIFTPKLVEWYNAKKPAHPEFELIFVSRDTDDNAMEAYMAEDKMPWPALKYLKIKAAKNIEALAGKGIPCLVFVDAEGKVLSNSYEGENYVGPNKVLTDIDRTLGAGAASAPASATPAAVPTGTSADAGGKPGDYKPPGSTFDDFFKKKQ